MAKKAIYKKENEEFLVEKRKEDGVVELAKGVLYKELFRSESILSPSLNSIVTVNYKGQLINGVVFDNSYERGYPEAFRLNQVIDGWQIALQYMHKGDKGIVYIPYQMGYGERNSNPIPGYSTLIFEVELLNIT